MKVHFLPPSNIRNLVAGGECHRETGTPCPRVVGSETVASWNVPSHQGEQLPHNSSQRWPWGDEGQGLLELLLLRDNLEIWSLCELAAFFFFLTLAINLKISKMPWVKQNTFLGLIWPGGYQYANSDPNFSWDTLFLRWANATDFMDISHYTHYHSITLKKVRAGTVFHKTDRVSGQTGHPDLPTETRCQLLFPAWLSSKLQIHKPTSFLPLKHCWSSCYLHCP